MATVARSFYSGPLSQITKQIAKRTQRSLFQIVVPTPANPAPFVANVNPATPGDLQPQDVLQFDVLSPNGTPFAACVILFAYPQLDLYEVGFDGVNFGPAYSGGTKIAIANGLHFGFSRIGGWPGSPTLVPIVVDTKGSINP